MRKSVMAKSPSKPAPKSPDLKSAPLKSPAPKAAALKAAAPPPPAPEPQATPASEPAPKPILRTTGLSPKEQKLQALRAKLAHTQSGAKPLPGASAQTFSAKSSFTGKKTAFQRKAV
jgi:hypothetical protein